MATELPVDVQILVIEWVFRSSQHKLIDCATLCACALVCRAWTPTAQRLLFRRIQCLFLQDRMCNIRLLVSTLSIRPHLAAHIRHIQVAWPAHPPDYGNVCLRLLELCRHVEGISFSYGVNNNKALSAEMDARMHAIQLRPALLYVGGLDKFIGRTIVKMCPGARVLVFQALYQHPLPPTVEALEIYAGEFLALSKPILPLLRHLCLMTPLWSDKELGEHLISAGFLPQLQSLQLRSLNFESVFPPSEILEQLTQLKSLVVSTLPEQHITLPASLRHVGFHDLGYRGSGVSVRAELAVDPLRALPELRLVTVTRSVEQHVRAALEGMCRDKGVDFGTYESADCFQKPQNIDWI
ncbi:hypothetical protein FA95DRAFT_1555984 [Auriscalpium vulgare]|uniref:Uncharacterized protein n=1 Tax=Auriscalpium vulgare TaxID=40419 RepID=A0ACB8S1Q5_9AGAM|nr:hypothetical protein FA95DRAFT_1555984 [Auriscalpium vulgare]